MRLFFYAGMMTAYSEVPMTPMPPDNLRNLLMAMKPIPLEAETPKMLRLWEIPGRLKCPLVGTCLSIEEHRQLLKKAGVAVRHMSAPELHEAVMENMDGPTRVARRIDAFFEKKFKKETSAWLESPETEIRKLWENGMTRGEIEFPLYLIASRSNITSSLHNHVMGELHMLGHTAKRMLMESRRVAVKLETALAEEQEALRELKRQEREDRLGFEREIRELKQRLNEQNILLEQQVKSTPALQENPISALQQKLQRLEEKNAGLSERLRRLEEEREELRRKLAAQSSEKEGQEEEKPPLPDSAKPFDLSRPAADLKHMRVLVVGGRPCMQPLYKDAVEMAGGCFEYHDGCVHGGKNALKNHIRRCDLVLCPVDYNSHGACGYVKEACRKYGKCLRMLNSSSRSAIHMALENICTDCFVKEEIKNIPLVASNKYQNTAFVRNKNL